MQADRALARSLRRSLTDVARVDLIGALVNEEVRLVAVDVNQRPAQPGQLPGRSPHIRPVSHNAGRGAFGIATVNIVWTCSIVNNVRCRGGRAVGSSTSATGLVLILRLEDAPGVVELR